MYEQIFVPLDGSELAEIALPYAEKLAGEMGSEVTLIHVRESNEAQYHRMHQFYIERMAEVIKHGAEMYMKASTDRPVTVKSELLVGHPAEQILDYADRVDTGLIVMATHGRSGIRRWVLGSTAAKVVRASKQPVMLIRATEDESDVRERGILSKVLVPLDGSKESEEVIPYVEELAYKFEADIVLLQVIAPPSPVYAIPGDTIQTWYTQADVEILKLNAEGYLDNVGSALKDKGITTRFEIKVGPEASEIISLADEIDADLIAMSTHGLSGIGRWAFGSTADKVLHAGKIPVLLIRASGERTE